MVFRAQKPTPPNSKASGMVTQGKVGIHDNAIHAVVTAVQKILVSVSQRVHHGGHSTKWLKILRRVAVFARRFQAKGFRGRFGSAGSDKGNAGERPERRSQRPYDGAGLLGSAL